MISDLYLAITLNISLPGMCRIGLSLGKDLSGLCVEYMIIFSRVVALWSWNHTLCINKYYTERRESYIYDVSIVTLLMQNVSW